MKITAESSGSTGTYTSLYNSFFTEFHDKCLDQRARYPPSIAITDPVIAMMGLQLGIRFSLGHLLYAG